MLRELSANETLRKRGPIGIKGQLAVRLAIGAAAQGAPQALADGHCRGAQVAAQRRESRRVIAGKFHWLAF